jgi:hypothetical protein
MREARHAHGAWRGGASWGVPRHDHGAPRFGPRVLGCTPFSPWVEARESCKQLRHECRTWQARRRALGSEHDTAAAQTALGALPATPAAIFNESGEGRTTPLTVGRRWSRCQLGVEDTRRRGRGSQRRGPSLLLLPRDGVPAWLPPTTPGAPSTKSRSAPPPSPHSHSPTLPPLLFLR